MKHKISAFILALVMALFCVACSGESKKISPSEASMRSICELATLECYYHNVAEYNDPDAFSFLFLKKEENFWIEYEGIVKIGIDVSKVEITVDDTKVNIKLPEATVLGCEVDKDSLTEDSYVVAKSSIKMRAEDEVSAIKKAQEDMEKLASEDTALLESAQNRAKLLLENYVDNIGKATGVDYEVTFEPV